MSDINWGGIAGEIIGGIFDFPTTPTFPGGFQGGTGGVSPGQFPTSAPGIPATVNPATGQVKLVRRRRRRRRLLTPTDLSDLAALKTIVGGGDALKFAVTKAVRR